MNYENDPVVEEIRETRRKIFKEFDNNPYKFGKYLAKREAKRKRELTNLKRIVTKETIPQKSPCGGFRGRTPK
jgi:hypothetical protein